MLRLHNYLSMTIAVECDVKPLNKQTNTTFVKVNLHYFHLIQRIKHIFEMIGIWINENIGITHVITCINDCRF